MRLTTHSRKPLPLLAAASIEMQKLHVISLLPEATLRAVDAPSVLMSSVHVVQESTC